MAAIVNKVEDNSIAQELEIDSGDEILAIDEQFKNKRLWMIFPSILLQKAKYKVPTPSL